MNARRLIDNDLRPRQRGAKGRAEPQPDLFAHAHMTLPTHRRTERRGRPSPRREARIVADMARAAPAPSLSPDEAKREQAKARWLWAQREPIAGTIAEVYLRRARGHAGAIPPTLAYLPPRNGYEPALIAAFGMVTEPEPGELAIDDDAVKAVQLIKLRPDGGGKADVEPNKLIIGKGPRGVPIVVAPPNDLLGLAICEDVEGALSVHKATGLGAWASGGATRMSALADAVPDYIDFVTIIADRDRSANAIADGLRQRGLLASIAALSDLINKQDGAP